MDCQLTKSRRWVVVSLATVACVFTAGSCSRDDSKLAGSPNVVVILIDTLRADRLGCYGNSLGLTPNIDKFAAEGCVFSQAFSHAPWTLPSTASLLTSLYPAQHGAGKSHDKTPGVFTFQFDGIGTGVRTIANCFQDAGYSTAAIVNVFFLKPEYGLDRGFDVYDYQPPKKGQTDSRRANQVTDWAIQKLDEYKAKSNRPFFLLVHYFDPHLTYDPPPAFRKKFALPEDYTPDPRLFGTEEDMIRLRRGQVNINTVPVRRLEKLYNGEAAFTDEQVGRLLDHLKELGLNDKTIVALTADHGDEFLDHGGFEHGHTLYDELIHVPLILRYPKVIAPTRVEATVGQIDVAPTLCQLAGITADAGFHGKSLEPLIFGQEKMDRFIFSQGNMWGLSLISLRNGGYKLIKQPDNFQFYHVGLDPHEQDDLANADNAHEMRDKLSNEMTALLKIIGAPRQGTTVNLSDSDRKTLSGLGYVTTGVTGGSGTSPTTQPTMTPTSKPGS